MKFKHTYPYFLSKLFYTGSFVGLVFLSSCSSSSKLEGEWVRSDYKSTLQVTDEKITFDNITERDYEINENTLKVMAYGIADSYQFDFKGDTLFLTKGNSVQKFIPKDKAKSDEEQIKEFLKPEIEKAFNQKITDLQLEKKHWGDIKQTIHLEKTPSITDDEWVYLAKTTFEDAAMPTATIFVRVGKDKIGLLKPIWKEILESSTKRYLIRSMGIPTEKVKLIPTVGNGFDVIVTTDNGSELPLTLDPQTGVFPKQDKAAVSSYFQYVMRKKYGVKTIEKLSFEKAEQNNYEGKMLLENGNEVTITYTQQAGIQFPDVNETNKKLLAQRFLENDLETKLQVESAQIVNNFVQLTVKTEKNENLVAFVDIIRGWYPENTSTSLATTLRYRIEKHITNGLKVNSVLLNQKEENKYEGTVDYSSGAVNKIVVEHKGTNFAWEFVK
ncbi:hypothetical protein V9L05_23685 (plasmid) [Bernardetia sp. Wsw4-3y2]|uniref:hypothetical protein n=1 Tax=Bernardetia sp. Wsw4-3y2 TaxID=3127471 RepID=UPI0030CC21F7